VQLEGCVRDAREVAGLLEGRFGFPGSQIRMLLDGDATRKGILDAMAELAKEVKENDAVVVHYSGHGSQRTAVVRKQKPKRNRLTAGSSLTSTTCSAPASRICTFTASRIAE
jgi:hypothetical protein